MTKTKIKTQSKTPKAKSVRIAKAKAGTKTPSERASSGELARAMAQPKVEVALPERKPNVKVTGTGRVFFPAIGEEVNVASVDKQYNTVDPKAYQDVTYHVSLTSDGRVIARGFSARKIGEIHSPRRL